MCEALDKVEGPEWEIMHYKYMEMHKAVSRSRGQQEGEGVVGIERGEREKGKAAMTQLISECQIENIARWKKRMRIPGSNASMVMSSLLSGAAVCLLCGFESQKVFFGGVAREPHQDN